MDKCFLLPILLLLAASTAIAAVPAPKPVKADMLVGAYYFPGWSKAEKWYCIKANKDVEHPLLGYYRDGDPEAADWHIKWSLEHGVSFFAFDFYTANGSQMYEAALDDGFLKAKHISKFRFCLNWCNHADEKTMTAEQLDKFGDLVVKKYLTHPSYLKIDGRPVVIFLVGHAFIRNLGIDGAKQAFERFEQKAKDAGLPGLYLAFCTDAMGPNEVDACRQIGVRAFCRYNYPYAGTRVNGPGKHAEFSYRHLIDEGEKLWKQWSEITKGDAWPTVMPGWDRRPWTKHEDVIITGSTPELFAESLRAARNYVSKDKVVLIEAWNEWGEGSVLEPSVERGFGYLEAVRNVFCSNYEIRNTKYQSRHPELDSGSPEMLKQVQHDLTLPCVDTWRFDSDLEGWSTSGMSDVHIDWGAVVASTTTGDPQMTSPVTYLDCSKYSKVRIRMMASAHSPKLPVGGPDKPTPTEATGQLFWSTTEYGMSGERSVTFKVPLDGTWHDYGLDLKANPNWKGLADRLRLDPVDMAGVVVSVDEIRLLWSK